MTLPDPHKGCLATFGDYSTLNLGGSLDVIIDGATTFKWRVNGGSYTTTVPIAASVVLSAQITVYFLPTLAAFTGYTVNDTWSWLRTDALLDSANTYSYFYDLSYTVCTTTNRLYFIGNDGQVMVNDSVTGHVRSVGYRPIYGSYLEIFENHLVVLDSSGTPTYVDATAAWSDLNNFDDFIATDTNEADTFTFPRTRPAGNHSPVLTATRLFVINSVLFVDIYNQRWATPYLGLPSVFSFKPFGVYEGGGVLRTSAAFGNVIRTRDGVYSVEVDGIYFFNGAAPVKISSSIDTYFQAILVSDTSNPYRFYTNFVFGVYNPVTSEVWFMLYTSPGNFTSGCCFLIYSENTKSWHVRSASFNVFFPTALAFCEGSAVVAKTLGYVQEDLFGEKTNPVYDVGSGTSFQLPVIELQDFSAPSIQKVKELTSLYLDAYYPVAPTSGYSNGSVLITVDGRTYADGPVVHSTTANWLTSALNGILSTRALADRVYRIGIYFISNDATKPTFGFTYNRLVLNVVGTDAKEVRL